MSLETRTTTTTTTATATTTALPLAEDNSKVEVIVYTSAKSDKTLKQNMNARDETLRKRTSLIIVPQQVELDVDEATTGHGLDNRNSIASMDSCLSTNTSQSNQSSSSASSSSSSSSEDAHAAYQDLQNGNAAATDLTSSSSESTSCCSSVDYSLREQLQNFANCSGDQLKCINELPTAAQLLKGMSLPVEQLEQQLSHCDTLLSPQEVPLGRRYAEVAQFKSHGKARASEQQQQQQQQQLPAAASAVAAAAAASGTPTIDKCDVPAVKSSNNNHQHHNHSNNNNNNNSSLAPLKSQQQTSNNNNGNGHGNGNKLNGQLNLNTSNNCNMTPTSHVDATKNPDSRCSSSYEPDADDATELSHNGAFEDDMQALLPKSTRRSGDELSQVSGQMKKSLLIVSQTLEI
ncbi:maker295 [Drosophila busckii]|uniref:Maker295 n=1 Tax=Drosophila busckii TaxID=30019 RepID=A0A0M5J2Z7_DROBS|nr:maker295 [Drosophila busckii]